MEEIKMEDSSTSLALGKILCCECGVPIDSNPTNMCVACLRTHVDITVGIPKQAVIYYCRNCERYLNPPNEWVQCSLESKELLAVCIKRLKGIKDVKLVDAGFIWTEPHSKRIKVKLTVHGEVAGGATLQQVFVVEYTVNNQMCNDCHRTEAKDYWRCVVQVRQKAQNKKTLYYLEQLILKHRAHENTIGIKPAPNGMDFFFHLDNHARKMVDFLNTVLPIKCNTAKKLISHDIHSNTYNYKFTYAIDIVPLSKNSLVCLSKRQQNQLGGISAICLVLRVASSIHLIDPTSAQMAEIHGQAFWQSPFTPILNPKQLVEYTVMDVEIAEAKHAFPGQGPVSNRHVVADVWLVRSTELGMTDDTIHTRSHLGHLLHVGDAVMAYNLQDANVNNDEFDKLKTENIPDIVIVKKAFASKAKRKSVRNWKLKHLVEDDAMGMNTDTENDYNEFLEDLEEDPELRQNVNIFKDNRKTLPPVDSTETDYANMPQITLEEMLDDLVLDVEMKEDQAD